MNSMPAMQRIRRAFFPNFGEVQSLWGIWDSGDPRRQLTANFRMEQMLSTGSSENQVHGFDSMNHSDSVGRAGFDHRCVSKILIGYMGLVCLQGLLEGGDGYEAFYGAQSSSLWRGTLTPVLGKTLNYPFNFQGGT